MPRGVKNGTGILSTWQKRSQLIKWNDKRTRFATPHGGRWKESVHRRRKTKSFLIDRCKKNRMGVNEGLWLTPNWFIRHVADNKLVYTSCGWNYTGWKQTGSDAIWLKTSWFRRHGTEEYWFRRHGTENILVWTSWDWRILVQTSWDRRILVQTPCVVHCPYVVVTRRWTSSQSQLTALPPLSPLRWPTDLKWINLYHKSIK